MTGHVSDGSATLSLAVVFGLASVPWTYAFVAELSLPLWPSFVGAATFYAAGGGWNGLQKGAAGNLAGVLYAVATIGLVEGSLGGGVLALSVVVGAFMFLASLHPFVTLLSYAPAAFFGYAALFGVHAAGTGAILAGLGGEAVATLLAMVIGAAIGLLTDRLSERVASAGRLPVAD